MGGRKSLRHIFDSLGWKLTLSQLSDTGARSPMASVAAARAMWPGLGEVAARLFVCLFVYLFLAKDV